MQHMTLVLTNYVYVYAVAWNEWWCSMAQVSPLNRVVVPYKAEAVVHIGTRYAHTHVPPLVTPS